MNIKMQRIAIVIVAVMIIQEVIPNTLSYARPRPSQEAGALSLPEGKVGQTYEYQLRTEGGLPPLTWRVVAGELPPGISLEASGKLRGVPSTPRLESYAFAIEVSDSSQPAQRYAQPFLLMIHAAPLRMVVEPNKLKIVAPKEVATEERKTAPASNVAPASPTKADRVATEEPYRSFRLPTPFLKNSEQWAGSPGDTATMSNTRVRSVKESVADKQNPVIKSPFGTYEDFNPARFVRIFEDTKRGDRYLIYEPNRREITDREQSLPRLGEIVARRYSTRIENKTRTLPTQLAVDVDSSIVIEPIPEAFGPDLPLNKIFMSASLKKSDTTSPLEVKNYAEIAKDQATMAAQKATAFQTAQNIQSVLINLSLTVEDVLKTVYKVDPESDQELDLHRLQGNEKIDDIKDRLRFYRPEIEAITNFLLDEHNLALVQIIGNDVFWIDAGSMRQIAKQIQKDIALAFDDTIKEKGTKDQALQDLFERAKLIYRDLKEARLDVRRLAKMTAAAYDVAYPRHVPGGSYDTREARSVTEQQLLALINERGSNKSEDLEYLIYQKAILVYAEKRADLALDFLKKLFTPGYVSLENADAKDGNLLTLTVEARSSDADSGGAAVVFEVAIRSFGAKFHLGPTMMFLNRKGVSQNDGSMLTPINYAPSPGMNFGITWFKRGDSIWNKVWRGLAPGVGVNVSFMNFKDPGFDQVQQKFTNTTGTDVQVGAGPYASFFNNKIDITTGWNLNVDKKRRYFGFGFEFIDIAKFLKDKIKSTP
jgi:putative Ig domain-containing protein